MSSKMLDVSQANKYVVQVKDDDWWICILDDKIPTSIEIKLMSKEEAEELAEMLHRSGDQVRICTIRTTPDFAVFENIMDYPYDSH